MLYSIQHFCNKLGLNIKPATFNFKDNGTGCDRSANSSTTHSDVSTAEMAEAQEGGGAEDRPR